MIMEYSKIENYPHLMRDDFSNSIVNTNKNGYDEYVKRREARKKEKQKVLNLEEEVVNMKEDLNEIKTLLRRLTNGS